MEAMEKCLIKKVRSHELLYKVDHSHYRDKQMRADAWKDVSEDVGLPADQCKEKWRKLRNCYLNAVNRRQGKNSNIPKWKYESEMNFLKPYIEIRAPPMSLEQQMQESSDLGNMSAGYGDGMNGMSHGEEMMGGYGDHMSSRCPSPDMILPETSGMMMSYKRRYSDNDDDDLPRDVPSSSRKRLAQDQHRYDETEMFFLSMSETVKRLRPVDQAKVKKELCNLVYAAEIRLLEEAEEMEGHM